MENLGYIKLHRCLLNNPIAKKPQYAWLWVVLILKANHKPQNFMWNGEIIIINEGQLITGRKKLSEETGIPESTIEDILKFLETQHQIQQQKTTKFRLITIVEWKKYQNANIKSNNKATTKQQQADTNKNEKNDNNEKKKDMPLLLNGKKPRTTRDFTNARRAEIGNPPMQKKPLSESQMDFINRSKLIFVFKKAVNENLSKSYFEDPDDIEDLKNENSKINVGIKRFWIRCKKDFKKASEVIEWFSGDYGEWCNWKPAVCFRKDTVVDFENQPKPKKLHYLNAQK